MVESWFKRISCLSKDILAVLTRIIYGLLKAPLLIAIYLVFWTRVKLTALVYCNDTRSLVSGNDIPDQAEVGHANSNINVVILTTGHFKLDAMKEQFLSKVLNAKDTDNRPLFPRFTKYVKLCAGYLMWIEETNFSIDDHIRSFNGQPPNDEKQLKILVTDLCNKPLPLESGWEFIVIPLEYSQSDVPQCCILLRVSHFISDGLSTFKLIIEQLAGNHGVYQQILKRMQGKFKPKFNYVIINNLAKISRIIYNYIFKHPVPIKDDNQIFIHDKIKGRELSDTGYIDWTSAIKMDTIRRIREATSTTVNDVLVSCMAGAFRKYFLKHGIHPPEFLGTVIPISYHYPEEPVETINKVYCMLMSVPTGDMDCLQRLKATKVQLDRLKRSPDNLTKRWLRQYWSNIIPYNMKAQTFTQADFNVCFSNMPGPTSKAAFNENTIESMVLSQLLHRNIAFGLFVFTYADSVTVSVTVDKARVSSRDDVGQLLDDLVEEVQQLYNTVVASPNQTTAMDKKIH